MRLQVARDRGRGRLVEESKPLGDLPGHDEDGALEHLGQRFQIPVAEMRAELLGAREVREGGLQLTHLHGGRPAGKLEMAVLEALGFIRQQFLRA